LVYVPPDFDITEEIIYEAEQVQKEEMNQA
jgi:hypothetical protein